MIKIYLKGGMVVYHFELLGRLIRTLPILEGSLNDLRLRFAYRNSVRSGCPETFLDCLKLALIIYPEREA